jgi:RNA recognition motif 2
VEGCNVGYAFVNFIDVKDLLAFAQAKLGVKWYALGAMKPHESIMMGFLHRNMYSSEKVLQMSYANYQYVASVRTLCRHETQLIFDLGVKKHLWRNSKILG